VVTLFLPKGIVGLFTARRARKGKEASSAAEAGEDPSTLPQTKPEPAE
jgi:urea transport system permease protein